MNRRQQAEAVARCPDHYDPENIGAGALDNEILDASTVEFGDAGTALPAERRPHHAGIKRVRQPIVSPAPIDGEQLAVLCDHLMGSNAGNAEARGQGLRADAVLNGQQASFVAISQ